MGGKLDHGLVVDDCVMVFYLELNVLKTKDVIIDFWKSVRILINLLKIYIFGYF